MYIVSSVTSIDDFAFNECAGLKHITLGNNVKSIGAYAFRNCAKLINITIPDSVTFIGREAFYGCSSLSNVVIGSGLTSLEQWTFYMCPSLRSVTLSYGLKVIGEQAFQSTGLVCLEIPASVTSIEGGAFLCCVDLVAMYIPNSVESIGDGVFRECEKLTIYCEAATEPYGWDTYWNMYYASSYSSNGTYNNPLYCNVRFNSVVHDGIVYSTTSSGTSDLQVKLYKQIDITKTEVVIPSHFTKGAITYHVTGIMNNSFSDSSVLTDITIPGSVTGIGSYAFHGCNNLANATFENVNGWKAESTELDSNDLADASTAATYLKATYCHYSWMRGQA